MTAEIAILNRAAAVLAADSAMTLGGVEKVYPGDKLFPLHQRHPVGVMIYESAEFMGVPWETLIKIYSSSLSQELLPTLREYADGLLDFVTDTRICTENAQRANAMAIIGDSFSQILDLAIDEIADDATLREQDRTLRRAIEEYISILEQCDSLGNDSLVSEISREMREEIDDRIDEFFGEDFTMTKGVRTSLHRVARLSIARNRLSSVISGVVVAGFGEEDMFPSLIVTETDGVVGSLRSSVDETVIAREGTSAAIVPLAQREVIETFMDGADPEFLHWLGPSVAQLLSDFSQDVFPERMNTRQRRALTDEASEFSADFIARAAEWMRKRHSDPTLEVVEHLPKRELAAMAEALVSITSLKRRVSPDAESVGGPTDVAVLSKGDGFEWVRGKHV